MRIRFWKSFYIVLAASSLFATTAITGPLPLNSHLGHALVGGNIGTFCEDIAPIKCQGLLPDKECEQTTAKTCDSSVTLPNTMTCQPSLNQSNACAGPPQYTCVPREYRCR